MFLPYFLFLVAFGVTPVVMSVVVSLQSSRNSPGGLGNYLAAITDYRFLPALTNVVTFLVIYVPAMLIVVSVFALLLDSVPRRFNLPLRLAYIVPATLTGSVAVLAWYVMLEPQFSPFRSLFAAVGITQSQQLWTQDSLVWIFALMAFFTGAGNWIIVQYGSLQSIPDELIEAARVDGASAAQIALQIKLPLIRKYLIYMAVLSFAAGMQVFAEPQLISSTIFRGLATNWSLNQLSFFFAFSNGDLGKAAAVSLALFIVCLVFALVIVFRGNFFEGADVRKAKTK